jgi:asparagine synthase (glutamine-hydrolysing)
MTECQPTESAATTWWSDDRTVAVRPLADVAGALPGHDPGRSEISRQLERIGRAYLHHGRTWPGELTPSIAVQIVDSHAETCMAASDPIGLTQYYYLDATGVRHVATSPGRLLGDLGVAPQIDRQSLFDYVYFHAIPSPRSIYQGVRKIPNGCVVITHKGRSTIQRYWRPRFHEGPLPSLDELAGELRRSLSRAVQRACIAPNVGSFLSGGLDSSTVSAYLTEHRPKAPSYSIGFAAEGYDEIRYARIASRHFGSTSHEKYVTPKDILESVGLVAAAFPEPFGNSSALAVFACARLAAESGTQVLLAGDGGDELFGGNERYAKQLVFERYSRIPQSLRRSVLEPGIRSVRLFSSSSLARKAQSYVSQANIPLPERLQTYNYLNHRAAESVFDDDFLAQVDTLEPVRLLREEYVAPHASAPVDRMLFLDWKFTLHDNDLVKVNNACALAGVTPLYPMLDPEVVDLSLRVPAAWKVRRGQLRWFYKRAMNGFLPRPIIDKSKHGFGLPFGVWTAQDDGLRRLAADCLNSLGERRIFKREFLSEALRLHEDVHAKYYGELVWILMVLELWLRQNRHDLTS